MAKSNGDWYPYQRWHRLLNVLAPYIFSVSLRDYRSCRASERRSEDLILIYQRRRKLGMVTAAGFSGTSDGSLSMPGRLRTNLERLGEVGVPSRRRNFEDDDSDTWRKARPNWRVINEEHTAFSLLHQGYGLKASHE